MPPFLAFPAMADISTLLLVVATALPNYYLPGLPM